MRIEITGLWDFDMTSDFNPQTVLGAVLTAMANYDHLQLISFKAMRQGSRVGFATVRLPMIGLAIKDCPVNVSYGRPWASLPNRPQVDSKSGQAIRDARGKIAYTAMHEWDSPQLRHDFSERVVALVRAQHPEAFTGIGEGSEP